MVDETLILRKLSEIDEYYSQLKRRRIRRLHRLRRLHGLGMKGRKQEDR